MSNFENIKSMNVDELAAWLDENGSYDDSVWTHWFDKTYCIYCELIDAPNPFIKNETTKCTYCEVNNRCKHFPELDRELESIDIIKRWLESSND